MILERIVQWAEKHLLPVLKQGEVVRLQRNMEGAKGRYFEGEIGYVSGKTSSGIGYFVRVRRTGEELYFRRSSLRKLTLKEVVEESRRLEEEKQR